MNGHVNTNTINLMHVLNQLNLVHVHQKINLSIDAIVIFCMVYVSIISNIPYISLNQCFHQQHCAQS
jgi:hypothetical protein